MIGLESGTKLDGRSAVDGDDIAGLQLTALARLDLAIDADLARRDQNLGLPTALDAVCQLEELRQIDRPATHADRKSGWFCHGADCSRGARVGNRLGRIDG